MTKTWDFDKVCENLNIDKDFAHYVITGNNAKAVDGTNIIPQKDGSMQLSETGVSYLIASAGISKGADPKKITDTFRDIYGSSEADKMTIEHLTKMVHEARRALGMNEKIFESTIESEPAKTTIKENKTSVKESKPKIGRPKRSEYLFDVAEAYELYLADDTMTFKDLASKYGVSTTTVRYTFNKYIENDVPEKADEYQKAKDRHSDLGRKASGKMRKKNAETEPEEKKPEPVKEIKPAEKVESKKPTEDPKDKFDRQIYEAYIAGGMKTAKAKIKALIGEDKDTNYAYKHIQTYLKAHPEKKEEYDKAVTRYSTYRRENKLPELTEAEKNWANKINSILDEKAAKYEISPNMVLSNIYKKMEKEFGVNWEQEKKDVLYAAELPLGTEIPQIRMVIYNPKLRDILEPLLRNFEYKPKK